MYIYLVLKTDTCLKNEVLYSNLEIFFPSRLELENMLRGNKIPEKS